MAWTVSVHFACARIFQILAAGKLQHPGQPLLCTTTPERWPSGHRYLLMIHGGIKSPMDETAQSAAECQIEVHPFRLRPE